MSEESGRKAPAWVQRLGKRWGVSPRRVGIILVVFACTGFTVMFLKRPVVAWFAGPDGGQPLLFSILYYILILPVYNIILLIYGALFGQFAFFWAFEMRFFARLFGRKRAKP
ncbi:MAG: diacylglyceryl transferase [Flavobacteriales bacterium]|nr:diacylglyceryl transferase [Flavobacteriales bacterium]